MQEHEWRLQTEACFTETPRLSSTVHLCQCSQPCHVEGLWLWTASAVTSNWMLFSMLMPANRWAPRSRSTCWARALSTETHLPEPC